MADLREALLKAARDNPESEIAGQVYSANPRVIKDERDQSVFGRWCREANMVGHMWFKLRADPLVAFDRKVDWNLEDVRAKWRKLEPFLLRVTDEKRGELLLKMAEGMRLLRDRPHDNYDGMAQAASFLVTGEFRGEVEREFIKRLYPKVFSRAIQDLADLDLTYELFSVGNPRQRTDIRMTVESVSKLLPILLKR